MYFVADALSDEGKHLEAFALFLQAAELGNCDAMSRLAVLYDSGDGVEKDMEKSIAWDLRAIQSGSRLSLLNLGLTYRNAGDILNAKAWFEKSWEAGDGEAAIELAKIHLLRDRDLAVSYLKAAISSGDICPDSIEEAESLLMTLE